MSSFCVCPDALIQRRGTKWFFSNPKTRTHVVLSHEAMAGLARLTGSLPEDSWLAALGESQGIDATEEFFGEHGLHTDHSGVNGDNGTAVSGKDLFSLLCKRWLLIDKSSDRYQNYFAPLSSILDRDHLGTFHQRVGQYMTIKKRLRDERWRWWHDQKFARDGLSVNEGPYKHIQEAFVDQYFSGKDIKGEKFLDFACGNGFYSNKLAGFGAQVTGLDTSEELIDIAEKNHSGIAAFICPRSIEEEVQWLSARQNHFDAIFMQDILLLLLNPEDGKKAGGIQDLLSLFHHVLKPGGCIYMMEPNPIFWLASRYGDSESPYAVVTEYRDPLFNVMPTLPTVVEAMAQAGFGLTEYLHPTGSDAPVANGFDPNYTGQYPIWDFLRFTPYKK